MNEDNNERHSEDADAVEFRRSTKPPREHSCAECIRDRDQDLSDMVDMVSRSVVYSAEIGWTLVSSSIDYM